MTVSKMLKFFGQAWAVCTAVTLFLSLQAFTFPEGNGLIQNFRFYLGSEAFIKALAEGFYYAALGLGIWTIYNRRKERNQANEEAKQREIKEAENEVGNEEA